jgi:hypothetical protein
MVVREDAGISMDDKREAKREAVGQVLESDDDGTESGSDDK